MIDTEPLFGQSNDVGIRNASFRGQPGWFQVPLGWNVMTDGDGQVWASPNADFSAPKYACKTNTDFTLVFQDLLRTRYRGQS